MSAIPSVAVIIPLRNESAGLRILIEELLCQLPPHGEIVAVNAGSVDDSGTILSSIAAADKRLRLVHAPGALPGAARNAGIATTRAPIVVQIDGGCMVEPGWIEALYGPLRDDTADYVTGSVKGLDAMAQIYGFSYNAAPLFFSFMAWSPRSAEVMAGGAAVAYKRSIWEHCNGQPNWLRVGEDVLFATKVKSIGVRHHFAASPPCRWQAGPGMLDILTRRIRYVRGDLLLAQPGPSTVTVFKRTAVIVAALLTGAVWPDATPFSATVIVFIWAWFWFKTVRRYRAFSKEATKLLPLPVAAAILAIGSIGWLAAEEVGFVAGWYLRISRPSYRKRARAYLKSMTGAPS